MMRTFFIGCVLGIVGCGPTLTRTMIENHPKLSLDATKPRVVEASAPMAPAWTLRLDRGAAGTIPFSGQAYAPSLEEGRSEAERDLLVAVASYVAVDVEAELEMIESERTAGGVTSSSIEATQRTKTNTSAALSGVRGEEIFWEKVLVSPLVPDRFMYRVYVHARVDRATIVRARLARQLARTKATGRRMVVVLPLRPGAGAPPAGPLAQAFLEELSRRLQTSPGLYVSDPDLVRGVVGDATTEVEALRDVREALAPDWVVGGTYQVDRGRVRVRYTIYDGDDARKTGAITRRTDELFELEDDLAKAITSALDAVVNLPAKKTDVPVSATDTYHAAYDAYRTGHNDRALALITETIRHAPNEPRFVFRLGRILERIGRYGRRRPSVARGNAGTIPRLCVPWHLVTPEEPARFFGAANGTPSDGAASGAYLGDVASAVEYTMQGGPLPEVDVSRVPTTAVGAYWLAFVSSLGDRRLNRDVRIAIADLFIRADQIDDARTFFQRLEREIGHDDPHQLALVHLGRGRLARIEGDYTQARQRLGRARALRRTMMERPYLLEIENELGQLEVEAGRYLAARAHYREAMRIADEIDDLYFRAVLSNNLGVLELLLGRSASAEAHFARAWRVLGDLDEAEGRVSTNLNIAYQNLGAGDLDAARTYLRAVRDVLRTTGQRGRMAELLGHEAHLARSTGDFPETLRSLLLAEAAFERSGRRVAALRTANDLVAAQVDVWLERRDWQTRICLWSRANEVARLLQRIGGADHAYARLNASMIGVLR